MLTEWAFFQAKMFQLPQWSQKLPPMKANKARTLLQNIVVLWAAPSAYLSLYIMLCPNRFRMVPLADSPAELQRSPEHCSGYAPDVQISPDVQDVQQNTAENNSEKLLWFANSFMNLK